VPRGLRLFLLPLSGWCAASAVTASGDTWLSPRGASVPAWCSSRLFVQRVVVEGRCGRLLFLSMLNLNIFTTLFVSKRMLCRCSLLLWRMLCRRCRVVGCRLGGSFAAIVIWAEAFAAVASSSADAWLSTAKLLDGCFAVILSLILGWCFATTVAPWSVSTLFRQLWSRCLSLTGIDVLGRLSKF